MDSLNRKLISCQLCPRLVSHRCRISRSKKKEFQSWDYWGKPVSGFGDAAARLLIVGLAPAAHGANRTGRMFTGDSSGDWLYEALHRFGFANQPHSTCVTDGLMLTDCYVTAVARCAPPDNKPTTVELGNCQEFLQTELVILDRIAVTLVLGHLAHTWWLKAVGWWDALSPHDRPPFAHDTITRLPDGMTLVSSYHPSRQNTNTRRLTRETWHEVFRRVRAVLPALATAAQQE